MLCCYANFSGEAFVGYLNLLCTYIYKWTHTIYCKSFKIIKFHGFQGLLGNYKTFPLKIACGISFGHTRLLSNCECFPANYSLVSQPQNFSISNDLQGTIYLCFGMHVAIYNIAIYIVTP